MMVGIVRPDLLSTIYSYIVAIVRLREHNSDYAALWRVIPICLENSSKSLSVVNTENLFRFATAQMRKSVFEPCMPFERQRL